MKFLSLSVLAGVVAWPVAACDLCAVYSANQARGEVGKGFFAGVAEQYTHFGTLQEDGVEIPNSAGQFLNSSVSQVFVGHNFTERFGVQFNLPVIYRHFRRPNDLGGIETETVSGIGDASLTGSFLLFGREKMHSTIRWTVLGGIKFPTGNSSRLSEELNETPPPPGAPESGIHGHDLALGSGSYDGIIGTGVFLRENRLFLSAAMQYSIRTTGDLDYRYANDLTWLGGPGVYLVLSEQWTLAVQAVVSGEYKKLDSFMGEKAEDTGVTSVFLGPQVSFTWNDRLSVEVGADLPVSIANTALQAVPDYRVRAGLTWHF